MLRNVNRLKTLVNDEGQMTNDSLSQLALIVPTYLIKNSFFASLAVACGKPQLLPDALAFASTLKKLTLAKSFSLN
ncbi:hypothetical protein LC605_01285 [Nostoc sp. CHAB 5836]|nr:hypothetical protein [Nostoc sp. CHAB 5836]